MNAPARIANLAVVMGSMPERRPQLVGQYVTFRGNRSRIYSTRWDASRRLEVSFGPGGPFHRASEVYIASPWAALPRDRVRAFLESMGVAPADAGATAKAARGIDEAPVATAADLAADMAPVSAPARIPECGTSDHPAVRMFVELVSAIESDAPAWHSIDMARRLAPFGYRVELIAPAEDAPPPRGDWCWVLRGGRVVSGLPLDTIDTTASPPSNATDPALPVGRDGASFERERAGTLAGPGPFVDPSHRPKPPSAVGGMTSDEPTLQGTPLQ